MRAVLDRWDAKSRLYDRGDEGQSNRFVLGISVGLINHKDDGVWQRNNLTPRVRRDGTLVLHRLPYYAELGLDCRRFIRPDRNDESRSVTFMPSPFMTGKTFTREPTKLAWRSDAYDVEVMWRPSRVLFDVLVKQPLPFDRMTFDVERQGISRDELDKMLGTL